MNISAKMSLGGVDYKFDFDEKDDMEALHMASVLGNPPTYCHECKNTENFRLDSNKDKEGNVYVNVLCESCGAKAKLGRYKAGGYFWHKFEKWNKEEKPKTQIEPDDESVPF